MAKNCAQKRKAVSVNLDLDWNCKFRSRICVHKFMGYSLFHKAGSNPGSIATSGKAWDGLSRLVLNQCKMHKCCLSVGIAVVPIENDSNTSLACDQPISLQLTVFWKNWRLCLHSILLSDVIHLAEKNISIFEFKPLVLHIRFHRIGSWENIHLTSKNVFSHCCEVFRG